MQINPENLAIIQKLLKDAGVPVEQDQFDKLVAMLNDALQYSDEVNRKREAEMGPEAWAKASAELEQGIANIARDFAEKMQKLSDSMAPPDKL